MKLKGYHKDTKPLEEGPMDFVRGAAREIGSKVNQSAPVRAAKDVVQAGRTASAVGDFTKQVQMFAQLLIQREKLRGGATADDQAEQQPPQQQAQPEQPAQRREPSTADVGAPPQAFRTSGKPKGRVGQHGFEYTFDSFLQATHGDRIDEGVWDFVKGAGTAVADKLRSKIQQYGDKPSVLKDIYNAGAAAHLEGRAKRAAEQYQQIDQQAKAMLQQLRKQAQQLGPNAANAVKQAVAKLPPQMQQRIMQLILQQNG